MLPTVFERVIPRMKLIGDAPKELPVFQSEENGCRYYQTPHGEWFPSITTVLKAGDKPDLERWKKWVDGRDGEGTADAIAARSGRIGNKVHQLAEDYLTGKPINIRKLMPDDAWRFKKLLKFLEQIENVMLTETAVYHPVKRVAGRLDLWATFKNESTLIDFKTSRKQKKNHTDHYFQQGTFYSAALGYMYPLMPPITKIIIVNLPLEEDMQILESDPFKWQSSLDEAITTFYDRVPNPSDLPKKAE
jgi:hypothetical protein